MVLDGLCKFELQLGAFAGLQKFAEKPKLVLIDDVVVLLGLVVRKE